MVLINIVLATIGYFVNPNSVVVSAPFLVFAAWHHRQVRRIILMAGTLLVTSVSLYFLFNHFYVLHPDYIQNPITLDISTGYFYDNIAHLDERFGHISLFVEQKSWSVLALIVVMGLVLWRHGGKGVAAFSVFLAVLLFSFCVEKTAGGAPWVYISYSRMYLGIPLFLALGLGMADLRRWMIWVASVTATYAGTFSHTSGTAKSASIKVL